MTGGLFDLDGRIALITGSSRGIGRATALAMARAGANVVVSSRKKDACESVATEIRDMGRAAISIPCNISRLEELETLAAGALK